MFKYMFNPRFNMAVLRLGRKKLHKLGGSRAIVIPRECIIHWTMENGKEPEEVELIFVNGYLKVIPVRS